jgi:hypothetical protein
MLQRRELMAGAAGLALASGGAAAWDGGKLRHILPTVSHDSILIKLSLTERQDRPPVLHLGGMQVPGRRTDTAGLHWAFLAQGLEPSRRYALSLLDAAGRPLCEDWPLSTFPAPGDSPQRLRVLFYTCAGGHDITGRFLPMATRTRLLQRALSFAPDVLVANGDHAYWDQRRQVGEATVALPEAVLNVTGRFDRSMPVLGSPNEAVLNRAIGEQITPLYGNLCRSLPVFFLQDDHDHLENDEATDRLITFPPDPFMLAGARASQRLWYPEFLPDPNRPLGLGSTRANGLSESFGTLRYGKLLEVLLYDCRRYMTLMGPSASFVPETAEAWLMQRMAQSDAAHVLNAPSTPPGWSAGKWGEWYADLEGDGRLTTARPKPYWQQGWRAQHDRLLAAAAGMHDRVPLFVSGDLHSFGVGRITASNGVALAKPVVSVLSGPIGTGRTGFPSAIRGMVAQVPQSIANEELLRPIEENGFTIADFTPGDVTLRCFKWRNAPVEAIDTLEPFYELRLAR